jgi:hypothetical protein
MAQIAREAENIHSVLRLSLGAAKSDWMLGIEIACRVGSDECSRGVLSRLKHPQKKSDRGSFIPDWISQK